MDAHPPSVTVRTLAAIGDVPAAQWDACAGRSDPFLSHAFLAALEESGSVSGETGWLPRHLAIFDDEGTLAAAAPLYLKSHSYGEYVFDWAWADAYGRAGGRYYPKLQAAVPFTPVTGRRLLVRTDIDAVQARSLADALARAVIALGQQLQVSSAHVTFPTAEEWDRLEAAGFLKRLAHQYHWTNRGYGSFEHFLADLASRKRKAIRKERAEVGDSGLRIRTLIGGDLDERHWDAFYPFYRNTHDRKWGHAYLNRTFFRRLAETLADRVVLVVAETTAGEMVAGALNLLGADALFGRYWGCEQAFRFLHFELCYYRAIEFAIERGLARVEAGAQGPHKLQRGYLPVPTYSAHWIADAGFRRAIARYLAEERAAVEGEIGALAAQSPFRTTACKDPEPS